MVEELKGVVEVFMREHTIDLLARVLTEVLSTEEAVLLSERLMILS